MRSLFRLFFIAFFVVFAIDQAIKWFFVTTNFATQSEFIDLVLTYNRGVAFSMFAFLEENLKFIQIALVLGVFGYLVYERELLKTHAVELGAILGAGSANIFDRFVHGGVVDYIFWHKWFNFAVFNFADVVINLAVASILLKSFFKKER